MEVDNETLPSAPLHQGVNQMTISMTASRNKEKAKAMTTDLHRQEVEEMEQHLEEVIQHAKDAGADPELTRASINDEGVQAIVAALLACIDALRDEARVMERGKERVEAENAKLKEDLRKLRNERQPWNASPMHALMNKPQWGWKRKAPEQREYNQMEHSLDSQPLPPCKIRPLPTTFLRDSPCQPLHQALPLEREPSRVPPSIQEREIPIPERQYRGSDNCSHEKAPWDVQASAKSSHTKLRGPNTVASLSQQKDDNPPRPKEEGLITTYLLPKPYPLRPPLPTIPTPGPRKEKLEPKKKVVHSPYSESEDTDDGRSSSPERKSTKKGSTSTAEQDANRTANLSEGPFPELLGMVFRDDRWQRDNRLWGMYPQDFWYDDHTNSLYPGPLACLMYNWNKASRQGRSPASKHSWIAVAPQGMPMTVDQGKKLISFTKRNFASSHTKQFEVWLILKELHHIAISFYSS